MKRINRLNIFLASITFILFILFIFKVIKYNKSERFYYISSVSNPAEFPIKIIRIKFRFEGGQIISRAFYKDVSVINSFNSQWGSSEYYNSLKPEFLPHSFSLEYIDFRTKNYYSDTILLPKEKMIDIFEYAKKEGLTKSVNSWDGTHGLEYHVGIANDGNIIFWLIGQNYETEFLRVQLEPKKFPEVISNQKTENRESFLENLFKEIPDSAKIKLLNQKKPNIQYKDSIPVFFDYLK